MSENSIVLTTEVGLAAYIRIKGGHLKDFNESAGEYVFETDKTLSKWRLEYVNSQCYQHDKEVMSLRQFKTKR